MRYDEAFIRSEMPMSRSERLLALIALLRTYRFPVVGSKLANQLNINLRTLYRDIQTLRDQGAPIEGEAGVGYVLKPGFVLPPLMFSAQELQALVLGLSWVTQQADPALQTGAQLAVSKILNVIPEGLLSTLNTPEFIVPAVTRPTVAHQFLPIIRQAIQLEKKLQIQYCDKTEHRTSRTIWPVVLGYFETGQMLAAWCELRQGFRSFRLDSLLLCELSTQSFPTRRSALLKQWRLQENVPDQRY